MSYEKTEMITISNQQSFMIFEAGVFQEVNRGKVNSKPIDTQQGGVQLLNHPFIW